MLPQPLFWNVHMYGIMIAVGVLCCFVSLFVLAKVLKIDEKFVDFVYYNGIASIALGFGAATLFQSFYNYLDNPEGGFQIGGMTFLGGLIGGVSTFLIVYAFFYKKFKVTLFDFLSVVPPLILIAHAFGRMGCFFAGCCYGKVDYEHGLKFPGLPEPVLPTMLYEAIFLFIMFAVCMVLLIVFKFDYNMPLYLATYGIFRFVIEYFRGDDRGSFIGSMSPSQFWSIVMVVLAGALFAYMFWRNMKRGSHRFNCSTPVESVAEAPVAEEN